MDTMYKKPNNSFLYALTGMEKIHSNYFDSAHGLFWMVEKKYALTTDKAKKLLKSMTETYNILQIGNKMHFTYEDYYLDSIDHNFFKAHKKKIKHPLNARTRHNLTNEQWVFQVIDRAYKRKTVYHFTPTDATRNFSNESLTFFNGVFSSIKWYNANYLPFPNLLISFKRIILYNKTRSERVNIDYDISFTNVRGRHHGDYKTLDNVVIVESKTLDKQDYISTLVKKYDGKKIKHLSKFYIGMHTVWGVSLKGKHKKELKKFKKIAAWK